MPWKDGYTTSDEKTLADRDITWPDRHQCAFVLVVDLSMVLHPHIIGFGHRMRLLETILSHIQEASGVWNPTAIQCVHYWQTHYPADSTLHLEPSIWKDYPGSLS